MSSGWGDLRPSARSGRDIARCGISPHGLALLYIDIIIYIYVYNYIYNKDIIIGSGRPRRRKPVRLGWLWCLIEKEAEFEDPETLQATTANNYVLCL